MQLFEDMYKYPISSNLFGLENGQMRSGRTKLTHNGVWYNGKGEKLGWGDLGADDLKRISREIEEGERFIVVGEYKSLKCNALTDVAQHASFVIEKNKIVEVVDESPNAAYLASIKAIVEQRGHNVLSKHEAFKMLIP